MTPVEILALITAIIILLKCVMLIVRPKFAMKWLNSALKRPRSLVLIYLLAIIIVGAYVFMELTIVQFAAVLLLSSLLFRMLMLLYSPQSVRRFAQESLNRVPWILIIVFALFAIWILIYLFSA